MGKAKSAALKIFSIIDQKTSITALNQNENSIKIKPETFRGEIEFHNVWFRYPSRKNDWVLRGLNLKIRPNETIALVGESGCGKSTLVSLLMRFYDADYGHITVDGVDIRSYDLRSLRAVMGMVMQEPTLFNYSIYENILYGKTNASNSEIRESAQIANALEFVEQQSLLLNQYEDSCEGLHAQMEKNAPKIIEEVGA